MAQPVSPGQLSRLGLGPSARSRHRRPSPRRSDRSVGAVSPRPSPAPSRPAGRMRPERPTRRSSVSSWPGPAMSASLAAGCTGIRRRIPHGPGGEGARVLPRCGKRVPLNPPGYVGSPEDRLCEPQCRRSMALSGVRVFAQDYLGAGIVPTPQPR